MYIYRIEDKDGIGPYNRLDKIYIKGYISINEYHNDDAHPSMWYDCSPEGLRWCGEYICGFQSIELLYKWFNGTFHVLKKSFNVVIYETDDCVHGRYQSVFNKFTAHIVDILSINDIEVLFS